MKYGSSKNVTYVAPFQHLKAQQISLMFRLRAHSTEDYAVVLDYLQFDNDMAFNFLISQTDIHTTLVLTDEQAEHLYTINAKQSS